MSNSNPNESESEGPAEEPKSLPQTTGLLLSTFTDLYRQEVSAEEDVYRTLPFFGTALGVVVAAIAYSGTHIPRWSELTTRPGRLLFLIAALLLFGVIVEAVLVLLFLSRAVALRPYQRIGPEQALRDRVRELQAYYDGRGAIPEGQDSDMLQDMREALVESYASVTPVNRALNERRYKLRAFAASSLVRCLIWALAATILIVVCEKLGYFPRTAP